MSAAADALQAAVQANHFGVMQVLFDTPQLKSVAQEVEDTMIKIMLESSLRMMGWRQSS